MNWATGEGNALTRPVRQAVTGIDRHAHVPRFEGETLEQQAAAAPDGRNAEAPAAARKAAIYATCFANFNDCAIGMAARGVLEKNGVETRGDYPGSCCMPTLVHGHMAS